MQGRHKLARMAEQKLHSQISVRPVAKRSGMEKLMQINIGKNIRELRHRDGRTQEDLATALGVTCQAVSRWEANGGYPDMEIVPAIANYFHVTIDELFGYHGNREAQIQAIVEKADEKLRALGGFLGQGNGDLMETVEMLRTALEEFPNEPKLVLRLADALFYLGWQKNGANITTKDDSEYFYDDVEYNSRNSYWQEALEVYDRLLGMDIPAKLREFALLPMILLCKDMGKYDKAKALANEQHSIIISKEILLPQTTVGEEADQYHGELILVLLQQLYSVISRSVLTKQNVASSKYGRDILVALINLYETVFSDGKCGQQHMDLRYLYLTLAKLEARHGNDMAQALACFEKGFSHHKEYCRISTLGEYFYSAPLVAKVSIPVDKFQSVPENFWKLQMSQMPEAFCEELRKKERYKECFEKNS